MLGNVLAAIARGLRSRKGESGMPREGLEQQPVEEALLRRGVEHALAGRTAEALPLLTAAVEALPDRVDALEALANVQLFLGEQGEATKGYRRALALKPDSAPLWGNLGLALRTAGELDAAQDAIARSMALDPTQAEPRLTAALLQLDRGELQRAEASLRVLCNEHRDFAEAHTALAHILLLQGKFAEGWDEYAWRLRLPDATVRPRPAIPDWDGAARPGSTLLITAEQGLGDQIMFLSLVAEAEAIVRGVVLECDPRLATIAARSFPHIEVVAQDKPSALPRLEDVALPQVQVRMGDLPRLFRRAFSDFPMHQGYLKADAMRVAYWQARLQASGSGPYIGISWRGGAARTRAALRSVSLEQWLPVLQASEGTFVNLQYGERAAELQALRASSTQVLDFPEAIDDYDETAALVTALDLVISVQTAVAHLAGALGKPAWVLVPVVPEWRYLAQGDRLPWYPRARLFRQKRSNEWQEVLGQVAERLRKGMPYE